jgi:hypothetical protein
MSLTLMRIMRAITKPVHPGLHDLISFATAGVRAANRFHEILIQLLTPFIGLDSSTVRTEP